MAVGNEEVNPVFTAEEHRGHVWGVWDIAERNPGDAQEVPGVPEVEAGGAVGQESLELKLAPSRRHGPQLESPG